MIVETLRGPALEAVLEDVARARLAAFSEYPYLHEGNMDLDMKYLSAYVSNKDAVIVVAREGDFIVGASTGMPIEAHDGGLSEPFVQGGIDVSQVFYLAESVLMPDFRGRGIGHQFFDHREAHARDLGRKYATFCSVERAEDDPMRPENYAPLDPFWKKRGYQKMDGAIADFDWQDVGATKPSTKQLQFWSREL